MAHSVVERGTRGLVIQATRITLYEILDYLKAGWTPQLMAVRLNLPSHKMEAVIEWLQEHRQEIELEYQRVEVDARSARGYWENHNKEKLAKLGRLSLQEIKYKLKAAKEKTA